jgi:hypothetical protein
MHIDKNDCIFHEEQDRINIFWEPLRGIGGYCKIRFTTVKTHVPGDYWTPDWNETNYRDFYIYEAKITNEKGDPVFITEKIENEFIELAKEYLN